MIRNSLGAALVALLLLASGCGKNAAPPGSAAPPGALPAGGQSPSGGTAPSGSANSPGNTTPPPVAAGGQGSAPATPQACTKAKVGPLKTGDTAKICSLSVTLKEVAVLTGVAGLNPGYSYTLTNLDVKNEGTEEYTINVTDHFKLAAPDGKNRNFNVQAAGQRNPKLQGTLRTGESASGWAGYLVKLDAGTFTYTFTHPDFGDATWEFSVQ